MSKERTKAKGDREKGEGSGGSKEVSEKGTGRRDEEGRMNRKRIGRRDEESGGSRTGKEANGKGIVENKGRE